MYTKENLPSILLSVVEFVEVDDNFIEHLNLMHLSGENVEQALAFIEEELGLVNYVQSFNHINSYQTKESAQMDASVFAEINDDLVGGTLFPL